MREYVLTLLAAAAVTYLLTPLVRRFAVAVGAEHAARDRDVHVVPTPLLGGFAMYAGLAAGLLVASRLPALNSAFAETNMARGLLLAGGLIVIMGFVDDRWGMGALSKLAGQVAAGVILVWSGAEVTWLPAPGGVTLGLTSDQQTAVTILVVVMTINAVNFIDGLDGLAAGIVGIGAAAFFIYYYTLTHRLGLPDQTGPALASAVLTGVCLGFLPHNFYPARIFMGDTGAMLIGLLLAYAPISSLASLDPGSLTDYASGTVNRFGAILPLLLPAAILLIPYADLLMAVVRRTRAGMSVFAPDKKHLHHRLLDIGHSHRTSVLIMYLWAALFAGSVVWLSIVRTPLFVLAIVTVAAMLALLLVSMPRLRPWARSPGMEGPARARRTPAAARSAPTVADGFHAAPDRPAQAAPRPPAPPMAQAPLAQAATGWAAAAGPAASQGQAAPRYPGSPSGTRQPLSSQPWPSSSPASSAPLADAAAARDDWRRDPLAAEGAAGDDWRPGFPAAEGAAGDDWRGDAAGGAARDDWRRDPPAAEGAAGDDWRGGAAGGAARDDWRRDPPAAEGAADPRGGRAAGIADPVDTEHRRPFWVSPRPPAPPSPGSPPVPPQRRSRH